MMTANLALILILGVIYLSSVANIDCRVVPGACNENIHTIPNLNLNQLLGKWYEIAKYRTYFERAICVNVEFSINPNNASTLIASESHFRGGRQESNNITVTPDGNNKAKWKLTITNDQFRDRYELVNIPMWVIDTDYNNYLILWTCESSRTRLYSNEVAWIMVRQANVTWSGMRNLWDRIEDYGLKRRYFRSTRQSFCDVD